MWKEWIVTFTTTVENIEHLLCHCPAYNTIEREMISWETTNLSDIVATDISPIVKFVLRSKLFCHEEFEE